MTALHGGGEFFEEGVVDVGVDDHALGADAGLAGVLDARLDRLGDGFVEIGRGHDDEGVGAAEFEDDFLEVAARLFGDRDAGTLRCP